jgi:hypothetical protein
MKLRGPAQASAVELEGALRLSMLDWLQPRRCLHLGARLEEPFWKRVDGKRRIRQQIKNHRCLA